MGARVSAPMRVVPDEPQDHAAPREFDRPSDPGKASAHGLWVVHYEEEPSGSTEDDDSRGLHDGKCTEQRDAAALSEVIKQRIHARTSGRIRDLEVHCRDRRIVIRGRCATFYTKQLAQHAAMGVVEDETLINEVAVGLR